MTGLAQPPFGGERLPWVSTEATRLYFVQGFSASRTVPLGKPTSGLRMWMASGFLGTHSMPD